MLRHRVKTSIVGQTFCRTNNEKAGPHSCATWGHDSLTIPTLCTQYLSQSIAEARAYKKSLHPFFLVLPAYLPKLVAAFASAKLMVKRRHGQTSYVSILTKMIRQLFNAWQRLANPGFDTQRSPGKMLLFKGPMCESDD